MDTQHYYIIPCDTARTIVHTTVLVEAAGLLLAKYQPTEKGDVCNSWIIIRLLHESQAVATAPCCRARCCRAPGALG
jgi:hypothetical protein